MNGNFGRAELNWPISKNGLITSVLFILGLVLSVAPVRAEDSQLAPSELACLKCHDKANIFKNTQSGETLSLTISGKDFLASKHKDTSCEDCHDDLDAKTHGKAPNSMTSKREFKLSMQNACVACHKKNVTQYKDSVHALLITNGSAKAPTCADCHNPHTVQSTKLVTAIADTPCAKCHEDIFKAYSKDVHGLERVAKGKSAPLCADCHQAHAVKAASFGEGVKDACLGCHKDAVAKHQVWLLNAGRHFEAISCPACHSPEAKRRVNLRMYDGTGKIQRSEKFGVPQFELLTDSADAKEAGLTERALWSLLKEFNTGGISDTTILRGRLEVSSGVQAHQISEKSRAIKDCAFCHQAGATPFQSVTVSIAGPDGRPLRHGVDKDVLSSLTSMNSVRGFYVIGSTRIKWLDYLLLMVVLGAVGVSLGHMGLKRLSKRLREQLQAQRQVALAQSASEAPPETGSSSASASSNREST
jgi:predicted CXXCH cytochrome family protein